MSKTNALAIALLATLSLQASSAEPEPKRLVGPMLLAEGDSYTIHAFHGGVGRSDRYSRLVRPGVVVFHTNLNTKDVTWMVHTGTAEIPTRRISYSISRLIGLHQTRSQLVAVTYQSGRIFDRAPWKPPAENGSYRVSVYDKESGKHLWDRLLTIAKEAPPEVPPEVTHRGIIKEADDGFAVFGQAFKVDEAGMVARE